MKEDIGQDSWNKQKHFSPENGGKVGWLVVIYKLVAFEYL